MSRIVPTLQLLYNAERLHASLSNLLQSADAATYPLVAALTLTLATLRRLPVSLQTKTSVSFIKDSSDLNSSVTAGIAQQLLTADEPDVGILNCGTGGVKLQWYRLSEGVVRVVHESKPDPSTDQYSLSDIAIRDKYIPRKPARTIDEVSTAVARRLCAVYSAIPCLADVKLVAVVTGEIRAAWESKVGDKEFEDTLGTVFDEIARKAGNKSIGTWGKTNSYFIKQSMEGEREYVALGNLLRDNDPQNKVFMSFGIGRGSVQLTRSTTLYGILAGMDAWQQHRGNDMLARHTDELIANVQRDEKAALAELDSILHPRHGCPASRAIIALKSGCLLYLMRDTVLLQGLQRPVDEKDRSFVLFKKRLRMTSADGADGADGVDCSCEFALLDGVVNGSCYECTCFGV